jgi:hypothetical protein
MMSTWDAPPAPQVYSARERQRIGRLEAAGWQHHRSIPDYWEKGGNQINAQEIGNMTDEEFNARLTG